MNKAIVAAAVLVVAGGAYLGAQEAGLIGGQAGGLSEADMSAALAAHAEEINAEGGLRYDDWSRLMAAEQEGLVIRITGVSAMDAAQLGEDYIDTRTPQAVNKICRDEAMRALSESGATFVYAWESADGQPLGTVTAGPEFCAENGA